MLLLNSSCCLFSNLQTEHICFPGQRKESTDTDIYRKTQLWRPAFMFGPTSGTAVCQSTGLYKVIHLCMTFSKIQVLRIFFFPCSCSFSIFNSNPLPCTFLTAWIYTQQKLRVNQLKTASLKQLELNALVWERR